MRAEEALVLVPALNEELSIGDIVGRCRSLGHPVCVIDDGSRDRTAAIARHAGATVLSLPVNLGVGGALRCGFRYAIRTGYSVIVQVDGDGQHDPGAIADLLETMDATGADMVIGSRFLSSESDYAVGLARRLVMGILARRASAAAGTTITDATSGFRAIRSPLLDFFADEYPVEYLGDTFEALLTAGTRQARIVELPITMTQRVHGRPSAGTIASAWYVIRVLAATGLLQTSVSHEPLNGARGTRRVTE